MVDLMLRCLTNLLFFDIELLYCYNNLNLSIISCLSSGDMYLSFDVNLNSLIIFKSKKYASIFGTNLNS